MEKISMDFLEGISIIPENVGKNIKEIRTRQMDNVSVRTIVERMTQLGYPISAKNYYKWESGETAVPSCAIIYLAPAQVAVEHRHNYTDTYNNGIRGNGIQRLFSEINVYVNGRTRISITQYNAKPI